MSASSALLEYYTTNYTKSCLRNQSILESPAFLSIGAKIEAILILPINFFGIYCILCRTPKFMRGFQWHLLHLHVWLMVLTVFYTLLTTPYHFYPAIVRCSVGVLGELRVPSPYQLYLINLVYAGILCSITLLFENRHQHLTTGSPAPRARRVLSLGFVSFALGAATNVPVVMHAEQNEREQESLKLAYLRELVACPDELFFDERSYAQASFDDVWSILALGSVLVAVARLLFFIVHSLVSIRKSRRIETISERTRRLQTAFLRAALAQVAAPISVLTVPLLVLVYVMSTRIYAQGLINVCILSIPAHSVAATAALLVFNAPYRRFVRARILGCGGDNANGTNRVSSW